MGFDNNLHVSEEDIEMFKYADKDCDGKISYSEFQVMINPPKLPPESRNMRELSNKKVTIQLWKPETLSVTKIINLKTNEDVSKY